MNLFKGLLFLQDLDAPEPENEPHYGAATAAREFARPLGNRAASERWFGTHRAQEDDFRLDRAATIGGCG